MPELKPRVLESDQPAAKPVDDCWSRDRIETTVPLTVGAGPPRTYAGVVAGQTTKQGGGCWWAQLRRSSQEGMVSSSLPASVPNQVGGLVVLRVDLVLPTWQTRAGQPRWWQTCFPHLGGLQCLGKRAREPTSRGTNRLCRPSYLY